MGNLGSTSVILRKDIAAPSFTSTGLMPYQVYGTVASSFVLDINEANLDDIWYSLNSGVTNTMR